MRYGVKRTVLQRWLSRGISRARPPLRLQPCLLPCPPPCLSPRPLTWAQLFFHAQQALPLSSTTLGGLTALQTMFLVVLTDPFLLVSVPDFGDLIGERLKIRPRTENTECCFSKSNIGINRLARSRRRNLLWRCERRLHRL